MSVDSKVSRKERIRALKFVLISCSAGLIQIGSFTLLNEVVRLPYWPAYLISLTLSVLWNFTINRKFTFKAANNVGIAMLKVLGYYLVFTPLSTWWGDALTGAQWNEYIVLGGTMIINMVTEYLFTRFCVYGKAVDTNALAQKEQAETSASGEIAAEDTQDTAAEGEQTDKAE